MAVKIDKKIIACKVVSGDEAQKGEVPKEKLITTKLSDKEALFESAKWLLSKGAENISLRFPFKKRPKILLGATYKIEGSIHHSSLFITINNAVIDEHLGLEQPYEVFINSQDASNVQWVTVMTRLLSYLFQRNIEIDPIFEIFLTTLDPRGGAFKGKIHFPSLAAELGHLIQQHFKDTAKANEEKLKGYFNETKRSLQSSEPLESIEESKEEGSSNIPRGDYCYKCHQFAVHSIDNCKTCLNCGDSKCG